MKTAVRGLMGTALLAVLALVMMAATTAVQPDHAIAAPKGDVAAIVDGKEISMAELQKKAHGQTLQDRLKIYQTERAILDGMIEERLLEKEAKRRGVSVDDMIAKEVTMKVEAVNEAAIAEWYEANKSRVRGRALDDQLKGQIRQFLNQQAINDARAAFVDPLKEKSGVKVLIDPPRVKVDGLAGNPVKGPVGAAVTIVEFTDFQCPFCSRVGPTLEKIHDVYGDNVRVIFRDFPLAFHKEAPKAHEAAACAAEQGKFWEYHDKLFGNQRALKAENLKAYAGELKLDQSKFDACLDSGKKTDHVTKNLEAGQGFGVTGTPAFFINGRFLSGAQPYEAFAEVINDELQRKGIKIPKES